MQRKIQIIVAVFLLCMLSGCNAVFESQVSNEYIIVKNYKNLEIKTAEKTSEDADGQSADSLKKQVTDALMDQIEIKKEPREEIEKIKEYISSLYENYAMMYHMTLEEYLTEVMGMTREEFDILAEKEARREAVIYMACELIAEKEKINLSEEYYQKKYEEMAGQYGFNTAAEFLEQYGEYDIKRTILEDLVSDTVTKWSQFKERSKQ